MSCLFCQARTVLKDTVRHSLGLITFLTERSAMLAVSWCVCAPQVWSTYSPVKNNPEDALAKVEAGGPSHSATSGELDIYQVNCRRV